MALSKEQTDLIIALVKKGDLSNVQIAKQVGCSESAVRTTIKKYNVQKNEITDLAKDEVQSIIIQDEIKKRKNELNEVEKTIYDEVLINEVQSNNLALNVNHLLLQKIHSNIETGTKLEKINVGDGVQHFEEVGHGSSDFVNLAKAIQTTTDNLGITDRHAPRVQIDTGDKETNNYLTVEEVSKAVADGLPD